MADRKQQRELQFGAVTNTEQIGVLIRALRKQKKLSLETLAGITNLGVRFISELERGKETVQLGKALLLLKSLGLEISIKPRDTSLYQHRVADADRSSNDEER